MATENSYIKIKNIYKSQYGFIFYFNKKYYLKTDIISWSLKLKKLFINSRYDLNFLSIEISDLDLKNLNLQNEKEVSLKIINTYIYYLIFFYNSNLINKVEKENISFTFLDSPISSTFYFYRILGVNFEIKPNKTIITSDYSNLIFTLLMLYNFQDFFIFFESKVFYKFNTETKSDNLFDILESYILNPVKEIKIEIVDNLDIGVVKWICLPEINNIHDLDLLEIIQ